MIKVIVPTELNDLTLGQMQSYEKLVSKVEDHNEARLLMLSAFCNIDIMQYEKMNAAQTTSVAERVEAVLNTKPRHELFFMLNGVRMGFIPNLDEITMGEFVDLENLGSETANWHKVMAILYRPVTKTFGNRYSIESYKGLESANMYKEMPLGVALGAMLFFWNLGRDLLADTLRYLREAAKDEALSTHFQKSGVGLEQYTDSLKETLDALTKSQPYLSTPAYIGSAMKATYEN